MIPYGRQWISEEDIQGVVDVLRSSRITQGPSTEKFERQLAKKVDAEYAVVVNSATSALHLACKALGVGKGDYVWTSPNSFVASANCALYCDARVDFVDIDISTYNICAKALQRKLEIANENGTLPKIVIPVHFSGHSCDMEVIYELSKKYNFKIIEDASHAIGGLYQGRKIGACEFSDICIFSFHPVKIITTGEGGALLTNDKKIGEVVKQLRGHGITRDKNKMQCKSPDPWYYEQLDLGYNFRLTDIQAALGISQLNRLDEFVTRRNLLAKRYEIALRSLPIITPCVTANVYSSWHLYVIRLQLIKIKRSRREVYEYLHDAGVQAQIHYIPIYRQPYFKRYGFSEKDFPANEKYYESVITLPLYPALQEKEQDQIIENVKDALL